VRSRFVERHPSHLGFRLVRRLRALRHLRGWRRLAELIVPKSAAGAFVVDNDGLAFAGNVSSIIEREIYLFGAYEDDFIRLFLSCIPEGRRNTVLDVGANVGSHSLEFSRHFKWVHSFEPNLAVCPSFEENILLNSSSNVFLHKVGLADSDAVQPFYSIAKNNFGLGTFSTVEQYDLPLELIGQYELVCGDTYVAELRCGRIDAVKVDVQGYEPEVISGLNRLLAQNRPVVWFEYSVGTHSKLGTLHSLREMFPFDFDLFEMTYIPNPIICAPRLRPVVEGNLQIGNYVAIPK
jgi:FkbM family methyltransferase